jgi:hypothetical protein
MTEPEAKEFIESIAADKRRQDSADLRNALRLLAEELNSKDSHFILELIQNAEDNRYSVSHPELHIEIVAGNPCGTANVEATLITHNNERGFLPENVHSLSAVGQSTKKKGGSSGYIGEKGIGFKSVFRVTDEPHIFSGPFRFKFKKPTPDEPTGYIQPHWVTTIPDGLRPGFTSIFLPLLPGKSEGIAAQLGLVAPETLLFLKRIRTLRLGSDHQISVEGTPPRVHLLGPQGRAEYFVHSVAYQVPELARDERRPGITHREISIAFPIGHTPQPAATVFAFLPTEIRSGLPFLINADFVVSSNREGILQDRTWNRWTRDQIGVAFTEAFLALLDVRELRASAWRHLPDFDKPQQRHAFFETSVTIALQGLVESPCIPTEHGDLATPSKVYTPSPAIRELLSLSPDRRLTADLLHPSWSVAPRSILKRLGVTDLEFPAVLEALNDEQWLGQQKVHWWISFLNCCKEDAQTKQSLGGFPALRCHDGRCRSAQSTVYILQSSGTAPADLRPEWPAVFILDPDVLAGIDSQLDLSAWFNRTFALPGFSIGEYIVHSLIPWIREKAIEGRLQAAVSATVFIAHQCSIDRSLGGTVPRQVPWILSNTPPQGIENPQIVTPEGFEHGLPWHQVLESPTDQAHLQILHKAYVNYTTAAEQQKLWELMTVAGVTDCPWPAASSLHGYRAPEWLEKLSSSSPTPDTSSRYEILETWLSRLYCADRKSMLENRWGSPTDLMTALQDRPWFPTSTGRQAPYGTFFSAAELREFLGSAVSYSKSTLSRDFQSQLGVQGSLTSETLIQILQGLRSSPNPPELLILNIYKRLTSQSFETHRFHKEPLIWLAKPSSKWMRAGEVTWKDYGAEMDGLTWSVERTYGDHELHGFFVTTVGVTEKPTSQQLLTIWATLCQQVPSSRSETQKRMERILRDLDDLEFIKEPWWPERRATLRVWTESGDFAEPADVYVPDSGHAEELFRGLAPTAWVPRSGSKSISRLLLEIGCDSLAASLRSRLHRRPEVINREAHAQFLTAATKELILLATGENRVGRQEASPLRALLRTCECRHQNLQIRYELQDSPWWKDSHSAAHWDADSALLLLEPGADPEEQRADAAKSIARALYPGDPGQHERIFTLLSKSSKTGAKIAMDRKWAGSPEHTALLTEAGIDSFLEIPHGEEANAASKPTPQRHSFPKASPESQGSSQPTGSTTSKVGEASGEDPEPRDKSGDDGKPAPNHSERSIPREQKPSTESGQSRQGNTPPPIPENEPDHEGETETPGPVKYPHNEGARFAEEAPEPKDRESSRRSDDQSERQEAPVNANGRKRQRGNPDRKRDIEKAAMEHVRKALQERYPGCEVFDVSHKRNYGHDYIMKWQGRGLRIEVKGHSGDASTIVLTPDELDESRRTKSSYPWELWNVTNLASGKPVTITRYTSVPDGAILRETGVRVDLGRCVIARGWRIAV